MKYKGIIVDIEVYSILQDRKNKHGIPISKQIRRMVIGDYYRNTGSEGSITGSEGGKEKH